MSAESEQVLVGAVFADPTLALTADLMAADFESDVHGRLWGMAQDAVSRGSRLDLGAIAKAWPQLAEYCRRLADLGGWEPGMLASHAAAIREGAQRRRLKAIAQDLIDAAENPEERPEAAASAAAAALISASPKSGLGKRAVAERITRALSRPAPVYPTGLPTFDAVIGGGLIAGKLYGIAARKKVGKTIFAGTVSHNLNRAGIKHLFVALEMSPVEIEQRNMAREFGINSVQFLKSTNVFLDRKAADYATMVPDNTIYEHRPGLSLDELRGIIHRAVLHHQIFGVIIDYWQLVGGKAKNETEEYHLRNVAQWLADTCRKEGLWGLVTAQLNQEGNSRGGEGLKLACDVYFVLHRQKDEQGAWLEMEESRYVLYADVGSEVSPGLWLNKHGPFFEDVGATGEIPSESAA